jgi:membrane protein implicated in regulation of membrane protease activity
METKQDQDFRDPRNATAMGGATGNVYGASTSYGGILREIKDSTSDLVRSEVALIRAEVKGMTEDASHHFTQLAIFGGLVALSVLPFIAFLVIGLGAIFGGNYWLSSLIVAIVFAAVGGALALRAYKDLKGDLKLDRVQRTLRRQSQVTGTRIEELKSTVKGEAHGHHQFH